MQDPLDLTVPLIPWTPPASPAVTQTLDLTLGFNETGTFLYFVNNSSFFADYK